MPCKIGHAAPSIAGRQNTDVLAEIRISSESSISSEIGLSPLTQRQSAGCEYRDHQFPRADDQLSERSAASAALAL